MQREIERLARQMMKMEQGERPVSDNVLAYYLAQASLAYRAMKAIEKDDALIKS